jgi:hypothetical protein
MGSLLKPKVTPIQGTATPLTEDLVKSLQGELDANALGTGVGGLQRGAGTAIQQFVESGLKARTSGGLDPGTEALIGALTRSSQVATGRQAGDLREAFGAAGSRFGSSLAQGEGILRGEAQRGLDEVVGNILVGQEQFNTASLLQAIAEMSRQGSANIQPFLSVAGLGARPAENVVSPNPWLQIISGVIQAGGRAAAAAAGGG